MQFKYDSFREKVLTQQFNWLTANINVALVSGAYSPDPSHDFLSEVPAAAILRKTGSLTSKAATDGNATGLPPEVLLFRNGDPVVGVLIYQDTGVDNTSQLIAYSDEGPGLPFVGVGFDYTIAYNAALGGFFRT